ncbi:MAG: HhH-GPD-type base excision DNA repair protein [Rhodothermales bacterium]
MKLNFEETGSYTRDPEADQLLREDGNALLIGTLLDQQVRAEVAFSGPLKLKQRLKHLDLTKISAMDPERFAAVCAEKPGIHRYANMMAGRIQKLAETLLAEYGGDGSTVWTAASDARDFEKRAKALPGFGPGKVQTLRHALEVFQNVAFH